MSRSTLCHHRSQALDIDSGRAYKPDERTAAEFKQFKEQLNRRPEVSKEQLKDAAGRVNVSREGTVFRFFVFLGGRRDNVDVLGKGVPRTDCGRRL